MLKPRFLLTKTIPVTLLRYTQGSYVNGDWVEGTETQVEIKANIQPLRDEELLLMPESDRSREWYKLYSADEIRIDKQGANGYTADEFIYEGDRYKVMKVKVYRMGTLDHFRALAARMEISAE
ncbi:MAG: hypothetical protein ACRC6V_01700 [Bacteroidales bacterium]